ncbi:hypothetical protein C9I56_33540 [Paraburkholderia caribensis]|nr:hypothetical protein C9I56_33540 [Paraburkholderia caribensis]QLB61609.1 hypothetical protein A9O66_03945 [Paraburkholderia caribensis]
MPGGSHLPGLTEDIRRFSLRDLKDVREVSETMRHLLADPRIMTFCFLLPRKRTLSRNAASARQLIENTLTTIEGWRDRDAHGPVIDRMRKLLEKSKSQSFNVGLLDDIMLTTSFAAFLSVRVCMATTVERIGWFSDRDKITTAYNGIANDLFRVNVSAFCQRLMNGWRGPELAVSAPVEQGSAPWCDAQLRIPDHFAGVVSAWDLGTNQLPATAAKYLPVLTEAVADRSNVHLIKVTSSWKGENLHLDASRVVVSKDPLPPPVEGPFAR